MDLIINSILTGFGCYSIIYVTGFQRMIAWNENLTARIDFISCLIVSLGGILFAVSYAIDIYSEYSDAVSLYEQYAWTNKVLVENWFDFWTQPTSYLLITQLHTF